VSAPDAQAAWRALEAHRSELGKLHLRDAFAPIPKRGERLSRRRPAGRSTTRRPRQRCDARAPVRARARDRPAGADRGDVPRREDQHHEDRAVLHTALRAPRGAGIFVDGRDVTLDVHDVLDRFTAFAEVGARGHVDRAYSGRRIRSVVNLGIGGLDLGRAWSCSALPRERVAARLDVRFVANVDPSDFAEDTRDLDPAENAVQSSARRRSRRSETLANAHARRAEWCVARARRRGRGGAATSSPVSTNAQEVASSASRREHVRFWDWVGGRYSLWSVVGLVDRARDRRRRLPVAARRARTRWTSTSGARRSSATCRRCSA
jgi:glucose-6-phosphate isomerase